VVRHAFEQLRLLDPPQVLLLAPPVTVDGLVTGEDREPGAEGAIAFTVAIEALVHLDEHLLRQVLASSTRPVNR
jgi:hypothetical protein